MTSATLTFPISRQRKSYRNLAEPLIGFAAILLVLWLPAREQVILGPVALLAPLVIVLSKRPSLHELGLGLRQFLRSFWILPAAIALSFGCIALARSAGTFHPLYSANLAGAGGYVLWTIYQQFLLQDYFLPRLARALTTEWAITLVAFLFAAAHLPNIPLTIATLFWGAGSCLLFRRYRSLYVLGLAQGIVGLCFAVCIPDTMLHHMRVGLGFLQYHVV